MADMEDKLGKMLSDPESMKKVMDLASSIMGAQSNHAPADFSPAENADNFAGSNENSNSLETPSASGGLDLSSILQMLGPTLGGLKSEGSQPNLEQERAPNEASADSSPFGGIGDMLGGLGGIGDALGNIDIAELPKIMQAFSGKNAYIKPEKVNLLNALKPYLGGSRTGSIDRAVKMANLAKAAKNALGGGLFKK